MLILEQKTTARFLEELSLTDKTPEKHSFDNQEREFLISGGR